MQSKRFPLMAAAEAKRQPLLRWHPGDGADVALPPPSPVPAPSPRHGLSLAPNPLPSLLKCGAICSVRIMNVLQINHPAEAVNPRVLGSQPHRGVGGSGAPGSSARKRWMLDLMAPGAALGFFSAKGPNVLQPLQCQAGPQTAPAILPPAISFGLDIAQDKTGGGKNSPQHPEILTESPQ